MAIQIGEVEQTEVISVNLEGAAGLQTKRPSEILREMPSELWGQGDYYRPSDGKMCAMGYLYSRQGEGFGEDGRLKGNYSDFLNQIFGMEEGDLIEENVIRINDSNSLYSVIDYLERTGL